MNETNDNEPQGDEPVETLLRQWGADEARRTATPPPGTPIRPAGGATVLIRWAPPAAAAVLLIAAAWLYVESRRNAADRPAGPIIEDVPVVATFPASRPADEEIDRLKAQLASLRVERDEARRKAADRAELPAKVKELEQRLETDRTAHVAAVAKLQRELTVRAKANEELASKAAGAAERLATLEKDHRAMKASAAELPKAKARASDLSARLAAAGEELTRTRKQHEAAAKALAEAQRRGEQDRARHASDFAVVQRAYLSAVPGQAVSLASRKAAAVSRRLSARAGEILPEVRGDTARTLVHRLEVCLIRLELLDSQRIGASEAFAKLIAHTEPVRQIDEVLAAGEEPPAVRAWLLEARLVLAGADHVG